MKTSMFSLLSLALAVASVILMAELLLNRNALSGASDELFYFINPCAATCAVVLAVVGIVRDEKRKILGCVAIVLAVPGIWLGARILWAVLGFMIHGDT